MCNLYDVGVSPNETPKGWEKRMGEEISRWKKPLNIRKTDPGFVARKVKGEITPSAMRWGFVREFNNSLNNARSDKLENGFWSSTWKREQRCIVPVAAFYEWTGARGRKQTYAIRAGDSSNLWVAGLWEQNPKAVTNDGYCFTMITTDANPAMSGIHHRMPSLLSYEEVEEFLESKDPIQLIRPWEGDLEIFPCENPLTMKEASPPIPVTVQDELF